MKIIKTNLSINAETNEIMDHQSYVQDEENWESFVKKVKNGFLFSNNKQLKINNLKYDDFHLSCEVVNPHGFLTKHLAIIEGHVLVN